MSSLNFMDKDNIFLIPFVCVVLCAGWGAQRRSLRSEALGFGAEWETALGVLGDQRMLQASYKVDTHSLTGSWVNVSCIMWHQKHNVKRMHQVGNVGQCLSLYSMLTSQDNNKEVPLTSGLKGQLVILEEACLSCCDFPYLSHYHVS